MVQSLESGELWGSGLQGLAHVGFRTWGKDGRGDALSRNSARRAFGLNGHSFEV